MAGLWLIVFLLYLPAAKAGFVADFSGWLDQTIHYSFWDNINRTHYKVQSLYQFTQLNTWLFYQVAGARPWPWHLLFVTLHALNGALLYRLCLRLLADSGVKSAAIIALTASVLFCITPSAAEVVVWEPSFHYLQGMLLILLVLNITVSYVHSSKKILPWLIAVVFLLSTFSLEIFYITPWLVITLGIFYRLNDTVDRSTLRRLFLFVFLPLVALFLLHLVVFRLYYGTWVAHIGNNAVSNALQLGLGKPAKHLFHTLLLGRFWSDGFRKTVYAASDSMAGIIVFYLFVVASCGFIVMHLRHIKGKLLAASLLWVWTLITLALLVPLWFGDALLIIYDRYTYFTNAFVFCLVALLISAVPKASVRIGLVIVYLLINMRYTIQLSRYWMKSERVISSLFNTFPNRTDKTIVLLDLPQTMHGAAMIGAETESEFRMLYNGLHPDQPINSPVYDAMAFNMDTPNDGAHVKVINDSTIEVTLNQWGTWWWYAMNGGDSYSNAAYRVNMKDVGHVYQLTLKRPASDYLLLFQQGGRWRVVDMHRRDEQY